MTEAASREDRSPAGTAAFLGSTQLVPGKFNIWGTLLAIYVLATGVQGLELVSGAAWLSDMFNGVALIIAVALSINRGSAGIRRFRTGRKPEAPPGGTTDPEQKAAGESAGLTTGRATGAT